MRDGELTAEYLKVMSLPRHEYIQPGTPMITLILKKEFPDRK
jgi:hypothetical protein